jgi:hypothetical protein
MLLRPLTVSMPRLDPLTMTASAKNVTARSLLRAISNESLRSDLEADQWVGDRQVRLSDLGDNLRVGKPTAVHVQLNASSDRLLATCIRGLPSLHHLESEF